jgi:hypothetical protein
MSKSNTAAIERMVSCHKLWNFNQVSEVETFHRQPQAVFGPHRFSVIVSNEWANRPEHRHSPPEASIFERRVGEEGLRLWQRAWPRPLGRQFE